MKKSIIFLLFAFFGLCNLCYANDKKLVQSNNCCSIAYINMDVIFQQYNRVTDYAKRKKIRQEEDIAALNNRKASFESEIKEFQQKIENNTFLSADRAEKEYDRLMKKESDLEIMSNEMKQTWEQQDEQERLQVETLIKEATEKYNQTAKHQFILTNKGIDNIITANSEYDITEHVLHILNTEYAVEIENGQINQ